MKYLWAGATLCILLAACGETVTESHDSTNSSSSGISAEDPNESDDYINPNEGPFVLDSVWDSYNDVYVPTVQFDNYIWMTQNVKRNEFTTNNTCFDDDYKNCDLYGRLYMSTYAEDACPNGFHVPTVNEWKALDSFRKKSAENDSILEIKYGGYCETNDNNKVVCRQLGTAGKYLTSQNKIYNTRKGEKSTYSKGDDYSYYSLRCATYTYIVKSISDLPTCDSLANATLKNFYVVDERSNYYCTGTHWVDDFSDDCPSTSKNVQRYFNDTLFICKYGYWQVGSIEDSKNTCTAEIDSSLMIFNGIRYACENRKWRQLDELEEALGYCNSKKYLTIDTLVEKNKETAYICDEEGWRTAIMTDYVGICNSKRLYDTTSFDSVRYVCRKDSYSEYEWSKMTKLEEEIGVCSSKRYLKFDTTEAGNRYICDSTDWRYAEMTDYIGECTSGRAEEEAYYLSYHYVCRNSEWSKLTGLEANLGLCNSKSHGKISVNKSNDRSYICDSTGWRKATLDEIGGECTKKIMGKEITNDNIEYYCSGEYWAPSRYDSTGTHCMLSNLGTVDSVLYPNSKTEYRYFRCDSSGWKRLNAIDFHMGYCTAKLDSTTQTYKDTLYACISGEWRKLSFPESEIGLCTAKNEGEIKEYSETYAYKCQDKTWQKMTILDANLGKCTSALRDTLKVYKGTTYKCNGSSWGSPSIGDVYKCDTTLWATIKTYNSNTYVCKGSAWKVITAEEETLGPCTGKNYGEVADIGSDHYRCTSTSYGTWTKISEEEYLLGECKSSQNFKKMLAPDKWYQCSSGSWKKLEGNPSQAFGSCGTTSIPSGTKKNLFGTQFVCDTSVSNRWFSYNHLDTIAGLCNSSAAAANKLYVTDTAAYKCIDDSYKTNSDRRYNWIKKSYAEALGTCNLSRVGESWPNGINTSVCTKDGWTAKDSSTFTDSRDGQRYGYVKINGVSWMTTNMKYNKGDSVWIPDSYADRNGYLYAQSRTKDVCPSGWRPATRSDWADLLAYASSIDVSYKELENANYYGIYIHWGHARESFLQNGVDLMEQTAGLTRDYQLTWTGDSDIYYPEPKYNAYEDGTSATPGSQYQYTKTIGLAIRCIKD